MSEHTPTPWGIWSEEGTTSTGRAKFSVCHNDLPVKDGWCEVSLDEGEHTCVLEAYGETEDEARANAAFIVRAVNAHDDLVAALKAARLILDVNGYVGATADGAGDPEIVAIDAALTKAQP